MKIFAFSLFFISALALSHTANAAGSMLRVTCEGDDVGAEISINGKFKGECPADIQVSEGTLKVLVRKKVDDQHDRVFEQELRIGDGVVKKIEAQLGAIQLNAAEKARKENAQQRLYKLPFDALRKEAASGNLESIIELSHRYHVGRGGAPKDKDAYALWTRKAADAGDVNSVYRVGMYYLGEDDRPNALQWLQKAAALGHARSMSQLGDMYNVFEVNGVLTEDKATAAQWYRKAAEAGDPKGMQSIGMAYMTGTGVPKSWEEGISWLRKCASAGAHESDPQASQYCMYWLGAAYEKGWSVPQDEQQAIYWWRKATEGEDDGNANLSAIEELKKRGLR